MRKKWEPIHPNDLIRDHKDRMSLRCLADKYGGSVDKIRAFLIQEHQYIPYKTGKVAIDVDDIVRLYREDISKEEIAERYNCSVGPIVKMLNESGVKKPRWAKDISYSTYQLLSDEESFKQKSKELISQKALCEYYGVGQSMIASLTKKYKIASANSGEVKSLINQRDRGITSFTQDNFNVLYYEKKLTLEEIANIFGISTGYLRKITKEWDIVPLSFLDRNEIDKHELIHLYVDKHYNVKQISKHYNITISMTRSLLKKWGAFKRVSDIKSDYHDKLPLSLIITKHFDESWSLGKISKHYKVPYQVIYRLMVDNNVKPLKYKEHKLSSDFLELRSNKSLLYSLLITEQLTLSQVAKKCDCSPSAIHQLAQKFNIIIPVKYRSGAETDLGNYIKSIISEKVILNDRKLIYPYELDIYIPSKKIAIEYCGLYWHSELHDKNKEYHIKKLNMCDKQGIRLITIFDDEYLGNIGLICNKLSNIVGQYNNKAINARSCVIKEITASEKKDFLNAYHIQGNDTSKYYLGLFHNDQLVSVMTFAKPSRVRSSVKHQQTEGLWELNRFASHSDYNVRGAASKLLSYFKKHYDWSTIYSYADKRWSKGDLYHTLGFTNVKDTPPNYWYVPKGYYKREYRYAYAKYKLVEQGFDPSKTERQIMEERGFTRVWDCGHYKFEMYNDHN